MSTKRSRVITIAAAGTLTLAGAIAAATLPVSFSPVPASADAAYMTAISQQAAVQTARPAAGDIRQSVLFGQMRSLQGRRDQELAAARATSAKAAARKAAEKRATRQGAAAQSASTAQPAQQAAVTTPSAPEQMAEQMLSQFGWSSSQFSCLQPLWAQESGWNVTAENPTSGAYGIPQALPGSEMSSAGADWQTDAATQIRWGLTYIQGRYGSPCGAWDHEEANGWY